MGKAGLTSEEANAKQDAESERELQDNVSRLLKLRGIWFFRQRMDKRTRGTVGTPDFLFALKGYPCAFEVKMPGKESTLEQEATHVAMTANGWRVWIIHSERAAIDVLNELEQNGPPF